MFVCDYILNQKKDPRTGSVQDVILNVGGNGHFELSNMVAAWYIGHVDGAPRGRIILIDNEGTEFILPLKMACDHEQEALHNYFMMCNDVCIGEMQDAPEDYECRQLYSVPMSGFSCENSMIMASMQR